MNDKIEGVPSLAGAIRGCKCPACRKGNLFPVPIYSFSKLTDVNKECPVCGETLVPEPDFFYGAMYISYALSVALFISIMVALNVLMENPDLMAYIFSVVFFNVLLLPVMLRYSKTLYLYGVGRIKFRG
ncbi:hypothetical protein ADIS_3705 [Lunatimonas lonarensis]|uniref:DUF983 domain-containing protein n=1 Tax=Lunatimonas lonarensis TaxID=1232681 RepID=R7ZP63_9BACT|nr:DUF983 domain-containing protein [Lunatimonas lonarensis]EON75814.1 hypothetical protein ADIS_3705 [Lunatimonas lonarensis]